MSWYDRIEMKYIFLGAVQWNLHRSFCTDSALNNFPRQTVYPILTIFFLIEARNSPYTAEFKNRSSFAAAGAAGGGIRTWFSATVPGSSSVKINFHYLTQNCYFLVHKDNRLQLATCASKNQETPNLRWFASIHLCKLEVAIKNKLYV